MHVFVPSTTLEHIILQLPIGNMEKMENHKEQPEFQSATIFRRVTGSENGASICAKEHPRRRERVSWQRVTPATAKRWLFYLPCGPAERTRYQSHSTSLAMGWNGRWLSRRMNTRRTLLVWVQQSGANAREGTFGPSYFFPTRVTRCFIKTQISSRQYERY